MRFLFLALLSCQLMMAQNNYPKDYFASPLEIPLQLSANFGELRTNHFHAGFDIRTQQRTGLKVLSAADGYVSRIKIGTYGGGKTLYITHPNGYTTVYCHLSSGVGEIENYIKKAQYQQQAYEVELFLKPNELPVQKGQIIALSGNTGGSGGPHLHFEIRDSKTEKIINPMLFGFDQSFKDTQKPILSTLYVYPINENTTVNQSRRPLVLNVKLQSDGSYLADHVASNGKIGFGITVRDKDNVSPFKYGVYKVASFFNGNCNYEYTFDTYSFDEMRYINALMDYEKYKTTGQKVQQLFMRKKFPLSIIKTDENNGILTIVPNLASTYRIEVSDFYGNTTTIHIPIQYDSLPAIVPEEKTAAKYPINSDKDSMFEKENVTVFFPKGTFYNDFNLNFDVIDNKAIIHDETVPVHSYYIITMTDKNFGAGNRDKVFIGGVDGKRIDFNSTTLQNDVFTAKVRNLGQFQLAIDTIAPTVKITKSIEGKDIKNQKNIEFIINDNLSGIKSYNGYLNGKWILFEYEYKNRKITHNLDDGMVATGANDLKLIVTDNVGNSTTFETQFLKN
ncbi:M23 family metallopeptidase [Flavobacterium agrisoli]|uniref:M23 family metallopeptidase n=1 Tax=Flavobacterium agrisoli TaxID=2793066 RepID=A0A934PPZ4_9FLAO|nr:M23 family metallopeptidase [Flavobacterium agrisoli]MBK0371199.1 M23 family metallopeptidase [Flavobacterium agrisoli]